MLISHFLLDLQEASQRDVQLDTHDDLAVTVDSSTTTLNFARAVGSIATTLRTDNATVDLEPDVDMQDEGVLTGTELMQRGDSIGPSSKDETMSA